jgi:hypothetical protein
MSDDLPMWTIYSSPRDYPGLFVAREWRINARGQTATGHLIFDETLAGLRDRLPPGLACLARDPTDDPVIVETWV